MVLTNPNLLVQPKISVKFSQLSNGVVDLQVVVSKEGFNKFVFVREKLDVFSKYDYVLLKDNDIRLAGFEWNTFLNKPKRALLKGPFFVSFEGSTARRKVATLKNLSDLEHEIAWQDESLFNTYRSKNYQSVSSNPVMMLEMFMVLMKADFAIWFFRQALIPDFLSQDADWGPDLMWCGAAHDYQCSIGQASKEETPCSLTSVNAIHMDQKQIIKTEDYKKSGKKVLRMYRRNNITRHWLAVHLQSRYKYKEISAWCKQEKRRLPVRSNCLKEFHLQKIRMYQNNSCSGCNKC